MLVRGFGPLADARARGTAVAAVTTYTLESTRAICVAAEQAGLPVIIQAGASSASAVGLDLLAATALAAAEQSVVPVGVHLDHSTDVDEIRHCLELGYTSVMIDGSHLPFEDNLAITRAVVGAARATGAWVEAELGALAGQEDISTATSTVSASSEFTDPMQAAEFAARTGVDALAVAVGNVHGLTAHSVRLDLDRLRAIASATPTPLVLHGASGLPDSDLLGAVRCGVVKVNFNAELRRAYLSALESALAADGDDVRRLQRAAIQAMAEVALSKIRLLGGHAAC
jgi:tagatose 1,6-diphosphate aldolase GatY/KbaY